MVLRPNNRTWGRQETVWLACGRVFGVTTGGLQVLWGKKRCFRWKVGISSVISCDEKNWFSSCAQQSCQKGHLRKKGLGQRTVFFFQTWDHERWKGVLILVLLQGLILARVYSMVEEVGNKMRIYWTLSHGLLQTQCWLIYIAKRLPIQIQVRRKIHNFFFFQLSSFLCPWMILRLPKYECWEATRRTFEGLSQNVRPLIDLITNPRYCSKLSWREFSKSRPGQKIPTHHLLLPLRFVINKDQHQEYFVSC